MEKHFSLSELLEFAKGATIKLKVSSDSFFEVFITVTPTTLKSMVKDSGVTVFVANAVKLGDFTTCFIWSVDDQ